MLSTGDAIRRKGADTMNQYFLTDRDFTHEEMTMMFGELAKNERTTRFTINATDSRVFPEDGQMPLRTLTNDQKIVSRGSFNEIYEDVDDWVRDVKDKDAYGISGSFDFDGKWTFLDIEPDGTIKALFRKDRSDILEILTEAEATILG